MTPSRKALISKVHVAKAQLRMADEAYRSLLQRIGGATSCTEISDDGLLLVIAAMQRLGWTPAPPKRAGRRPRPPAHNDGLMSKIEAQLAAAGRDWAYADGIAQRMYGIAKVAWLKEAAQLRAVIAALYKDAARHGRAKR